MKIAPITLRASGAFIAQHHRHNKPPRGWKFGVGLLSDDGTMVGVGVAGRPSARALDDGKTIEVTRTCTDGTKNANSMLYGAIWRAAKAMGYVHGVTYTQGDESGASLKAAGWRLTASLPARASWAESTKDERLKGMRDPVGSGGVSRCRWEIWA